jgi:hypothetical protein
MNGMSTKVEIYSMSNCLRDRSFYASTRVVKVILLTGVVSSLTCPISTAASVDNWVIGYATTATYSDAHQLDVIIHTTSDDLPTEAPLSNTDEVKPSNIDAERDRVAPTTQESSPTHSEAPPSGNEHPTEPQH